LPPFRAVGSGLESRKTDPGTTMNAADTAIILIATALVLVMTLPGLALF